MVYINDGGRIVERKLTCAIYPSIQLQGEVMRNLSTSFIKLPSDIYGSSRHGVFLSGHARLRSHS